MQFKTIKLQSNRIEIHFFNYCKENEVLMENTIYSRSKLASHQAMCFKASTRYNLPTITFKQWSGNKMSVPSPFCVVLDEKLTFDFHLKGKIM